MRDVLEALDHLHNHKVHFGSIGCPGQHDEMREIYYAAYISAAFMQLLRQDQPCNCSVQIC